MTPPDQVPEAQPRVHVQSQAHLEYVSVAHPYVAPRDPDPSRKGDRYASMKVWHASLEDGLDNLETRLAELMRQLEN
jgi:hypothetical protein